MVFRSYKGDADIVSGTTESEEDINWESDDESTDPVVTNASVSSTEFPTSTTITQLSVDSNRETVTATKASVVSTPATGSPRHSSEDSYDVVSSQVSNNGDVKAAGEGSRKGDDDEDESDWE